MLEDACCSELWGKDDDGDDSVVGTVIALAVKVKAHIIAASEGAARVVRSSESAIKFKLKFH